MMSFRVVGRMDRPCDIVHSLHGIFYAMKSIVRRLCI